MSASEPPLLDVRDLTVAYDGARVLHGVSLTIARGRTAALLGANGAGKTTFLRALCGRVKAGGRILLEGDDIRGWAPDAIARRGVAQTPEERGVFARLSVEENLQLGAITRRGTRAIARDIATMYDHFPRLRERRRQQAGALSGGEQQMLAIGRALMMRPKLLLLDEPSFGLAPLLVEDMFSILSALTHERGVAILIVEQNAGLALNLANEAYLLERGRIVRFGPASVMADDATLRQAYLGGPGGGV